LKIQGWARIENMKSLLYICGAVSLVIGIYELVWISRGSELAVVLMLLAFIVAVLSFGMAKKW